VFFIVRGYGKRALRTSSEWQPQRAACYHWRKFEALGAASRAAAARRRRRRTRVALSTAGPVRVIERAAAEAQGRLQGARLKLTIGLKLIRQASLGVCGLSEWPSTEVK
jgi:hypothetical protein